MRREAYTTTTQIPYVVLRTEGWTCVRCGLGRYCGGSCSSCGLEVTTAARLPRVLVREDLRAAAERRGAA